MSKQTGVGLRVRLAGLFLETEAYTRRAAAGDMTSSFSIVVGRRRCPRRTTFTIGELPSDELEVGGHRAGSLDV